MKKIFRPYTYLLSVHVAALLLLSVIRLFFYIAVKEQITGDAAGNASWICAAFLRGLWFDNVIACYITALPLLATSVATALNMWKNRFIRTINIWYAAFYTLVFMAAAGNIPYFVYFSKPLNASIWNWAEYGTTTMGMIFGESAYYPYILLFAVSTVLFIWFLRRLRKRFAKTPQDTTTGSMQPSACKRITAVGLLTLFLGSLCFIGIRGRLGYNPIKVSAAYFCTNPVLNNLGVNATFALLNSTLDDLRPENKELHLMPPEEALREAQSLYGRQGLNGISPMARIVIPEGEKTGQNVVVVLMESMSAKFMRHFGNKHNLTPQLDSLFNSSLSFDNCYSAGNHTNHGLYATLYSFPSIMFRNAMKGTNIPQYSGLPTILKENGYDTMFFMTHESQYDNMNAFFRTNGYDEIYSQENYPKEKVVNHFGVADDFLFSYALPVLRKHAESGRPFFATLLTISNHPPYIIPERFNDPKLTPEEQIVRYADDCIGQFIKKAKKEAWGKNTIFVFVGDHGKLVGKADCELPESFNHVPLIFHGNGIQPDIRHQFTGQIDIAPTILGMLRIPYTQNNLGLDLLSDTPRPATFYTADKTIAARDANTLYVFNAETGKEYVYALPQIKAAKPSEASRKLKRYAFSLLQTTEYMVQNGMTTNKPHNNAR